MKRQLLISSIAFLILVIGIIGATNSFFVNFIIYYISLGLIVVSLITLFTIFINHFIVNYKVAIPRKRLRLIIGFFLLLIIVLVTFKFLFDGTIIYIFEEMF